MEACSSKLPKYINDPATNLIIRDCLRNKKGFRVYQMEQMAELEEDDTETSVFDHTLASTYSYRYDSGNIKQYVYSALEALCYECGCFLWSDLGMLSVHFIIYSFI